MQAMRVLVALLAIAGISSVAEAKRHPRPKHAARSKRSGRVALPEPVTGQSVGAPWQGLLRDAARLPDGDGYHIRRPWRSYGTRSTVELVERVITEWRDEFPHAHVLAIGDLSAEHGGPITEHHSHQTGRDADIGLIYKVQPRGYPASFVVATQDNLDCAATFALVEDFAKTARADGGAQVMFLDFNVQGMLYRWAKEHGVEDDELDHLFQYPHRGQSVGLVRHEPNHANHLHVRFKCPREDSGCR